MSLATPTNAAVWPVGLMNDAKPPFSLPITATRRTPVASQAVMSPIAASPPVPRYAEDFPSLFCVPTYAPKSLSAALYVLLGWTGSIAFPAVTMELGWVATVLLLLGGVLYSLGAAVYALRRPDPAPAVFGYHEVFHALVILAVSAHWAAIAFWLLPHHAA